MAFSCYYIDDWLVCAPSESLAQGHMDTVLAHFPRVASQCGKELPGPNQISRVLILVSATTTARFTQKRIYAPHVRTPESFTGLYAFPSLPPLLVFPRRVRLLCAKLHLVAPKDGRDLRDAEGPTVVASS